MYSVEFEPAIPAIERLYSYALDLMANWIGSWQINRINNFVNNDAFKKAMSYFSTFSADGIFKNWAVSVAVISDWYVKFCYEACGTPYI